MTERTGIQSIRSVLGSKPHIFVHGSPNVKSGAREEQFLLERALTLSQSGDTVVMNAFPVDYIEYLDEIGFPRGNVALVHANEYDDSVMKILQGPDFASRFQGFQGSFYEGFDNFSLIAQNLGLETRIGYGPETVSQFEDKEGFKEVCREIGLPIVEGRVYQKEGENSKEISSLDSLLREMLHENRAIIVRSTSGAGVNYSVTLENLTAVEHDMIYGKGADKNRFVVDPKIEVVASPNIMFYHDGVGGAEMVTTSNQVQDGLVYLGNEFYFPQEKGPLAEEAELMARELSSRGYSGLAGYDAIINPFGDWYWVESNVRPNGNGYGYEALSKIEQMIGVSIGYGFMEKTSVRTDEFLELRKMLGDNLFSGARSEGVFPFNTSMLKGLGSYDGSPQINLVYFGDSKEQVLSLRDEVQGSIRKDTITKRPMYSSLV